MANFCFDWAIPTTGCSNTPKKAGVYQIWITESQNIESITVTATTGAIDAETEGAVTAITMATGTKFLKLNPRAATASDTETLENGILTQSMTFSLDNLSNITRGIIRQISECDCGVSVILFYNGDSRPKLIHGNELDVYGNIINNSPLRLTTAALSSGTVITDDNSAVITFTRENGTIEQLGRMLNMADAAITALLTAA
jgi:hypothetical protein